MAHQPDQALTTAIANVLREARDRGMSTRDIADYFGVADPTISRWESGDRQPALDLLPSFDRLAGRPRGYTLRLAGYVEDADLDLRALIMTAAELDPEGRKIIAGMYDALRRSRGDAVPAVKASAKPPRRVRNTART